VNKDKKFVASDLDMNHVIDHEKRH